MNAPTPEQSAQADPNMPITVALPLGHVMGLINVLGQLPINSGVAPICDAIVQQANAQVANAQMPKNRQQRRAEAKAKPAAVKPVTPKAPAKGSAK